MKVRKVVAAVIGVTAVSMGGWLVTANHSPAVSATVAPTRVVDKASVAPKCSVPTPTTAAGFSRLWDKLPASEWIAADLSISTKLPDGRSVWLYGDTFSTGRFVHSTAIVQRGGCLHVSAGGSQLLPNRDASHIYWIESARVSGSKLLVTARAITLNGTCGWCFKDGGSSRTAVTRVTANGDVEFERWVNAGVVGPLTSAGPLLPCPGQLVATSKHFCYALHAHHEFKLASGKTLYTIAQNWDDGMTHPLKDYRMLFLER